MSEVNNITARRGLSQAMAFAAKGGTGLSSLLFGIAKRKEEEGKGPIETMVFLDLTYSTEEGHNIPVVGSKQGETGNEPYDRYTAEVTTADGKRKVPGSWYTDVVKSTQAWEDLNQRREWCKEGQGEGIPADILAMKTGERAVEKKRISNFIANMRTGLTKGAMLLHQVEAIQAINPARIRVKLPTMLQKDAAGNEVVVVTGSLIRIYDDDDTSDKVEPEVVSVGSFLQYDAAKCKASEDGGTITSLKATASKAPKGSKTGGKSTALTVPTTIEQVLTMFNALASAVDNGTEHGNKMQAALLARCAKPGAEGDEAVISVGNVCMAADNVWNVIGTRYQTIMAAQAAALNIKKSA